MVNEGYLKDKAIKGKPIMTKTSIDKVLVTIDGSERSFETVIYLAALPALCEAKINLLHIYPKIHASYYEIAEKAAGMKLANSLRIWEQQQRQKIEMCMEKCRDVLLAADFNPQHIQISINHCRHGIARDIVEETDNGYMALFLRRRGISSLPALVMGSVALKLFNAVNDVPLIFAGRKAANNRILIAIDHFEEALRAVEFVKKMVRGKTFKIGFISVIRRDSVPPHAFSEDGDGNIDPNIYEKKFNELFNMVRERLESEGIRPENIHSEIVKNSFSRAGAIVEKAERENYSTIVIGRRNTARTRSFYIGRVSNKIIQISPKQHVWIVP
jgi:nucleotide-binding universal stress UspA family protein